MSARIETPTLWSIINWASASPLITDCVRFSVKSIRLRGAVKSAHLHFLATLNRLLLTDPLNRL